MVVRYRYLEDEGRIDVWTELTYRLLVQEGLIESGKTRITLLCQSLPYENYNPKLKRFEFSLDNAPQSVLYVLGWRSKKKSKS